MTRFRIQAEKAGLSKNTQKSNAVIQCQKANDERLLRNTPAIDIDAFPGKRASERGRKQNVHSRDGWNIETAKRVWDYILH